MKPKVVYCSMLAFHFHSDPIIVCVSFLLVESDSPRKINYRPMCDNTFSLALSWHDYYDEQSMRQREISVCMCVITSLATHEMVTTVNWASFRLPRGLKISMQSLKWKKNEYDPGMICLLVHSFERPTDRLIGVSPAELSEMRQITFAVHSWHNIAMGNCHWLLGRL